jgi:hypothetical protein
MEMLRFRPGVSNFTVFNGFAGHKNALKVFEVRIFAQFEHQLTDYGPNF